MNQELTVLKLGGSLITDKSIPYTVRDKILESVSREIKECMDLGLIKSLVLVQGVGSYGHPLVLEHNLHKGYLGPQQLLPLSKTQAKVAELRAIVVKNLQNAEIPACLLCPSSMITSDKMKMARHFFEPLKGFLSLGMVPLLGGDVLIDTVMGWSVGSGDPLAVLISRELGAKKLIFASDVAGIFDDDPKLNPSATQFDEINLKEIEQVTEQMGVSGVVDASGAMKGKLASIEPAKDLIEGGLEVSLISMMEQGALKALLGGNKSKSTQVVVR